MKRFLILFFVFQIFRFTLYSSFLDTGLGARGIGMGNTLSSSGGDLYSIYYNPAGLSFVKRSEVSTNLSQFYAGLKDGSSIGEYFIGSCMRLKNGAIGIGIRSLKADSFYKEDVYYLGFGQDLGEKLYFKSSVGMTLKFLSHKYGSTDYTYNSLINSGDSYTGEIGGMDPVFKNGFSKTAFSLDFGIISKLNKNFKVSLALKDILKPDVGLKERDIIPLKLDLGFSLEDRDFLFNFVLRREKSYNDLRIGVEKWIRKFALRTGIEYGSQKLLLLNFGFGWLEKEILSFDYSFTMTPGLSENYGTHRLSISYKFGEPVEEEVYEEKVSEKEKEVEVKVISEEDKAKVLSILKEVENKIIEGNFKEAFVLSQEALGLWPDNEIAKNFISKLEPIILYYPEVKATNKKNGLIKRALIAYMYDKGKESLNRIRYVSQLWPMDINIIAVRNIIEARFPELASQEKLVPGLNLVQQKLQKALEYIYDGKYIAAVSECQEVLDLEPENVLAYMRLGSAYMAMGNEKKAKEVWRKALKYDPNNKQILKFLKESPKEKIHRPKEKEKPRIIKKKKVDAETKRNFERAIAYYEKMKKEGASKELRKALLLKLKKKFENTGLDLSYIEKELKEVEK